MEQEEIWKDVIGYEGLYQVSNLGNVKSLDRKRLHPKGFYRKYKSRLIKPDMIKGYKRVKFSDSTISRITVHRLVAIHFIPNPENKPHVNHINTIRTDNRVENLEWVTHRENMCHKSVLSNNSTEYIGVSFVKGMNRYQTSVFFNGKKHYLGSFKDKIDAKKAHDDFLEINSIKNKYK